MAAMVWPVFPKGKRCFCHLCFPRKKSARPLCRRRALFPAPPWTRCSRLKVRGGNDFAIGYYRLNSHDLLPVRECPISSKLINRVLQQVWELGEAGKVPAGISEIEFFADAADARMMLEIYLAADAPDM